MDANRYFSRPQACGLADVHCKGEILRFVAARPEKLAEKKRGHSTQNDNAIRVIRGHVFVPKVSEILTARTYLSNVLVRSAG